jgi:RNA polymerase sigma factor (sigma-70 family)
LRTYLIFVAGTFTGGRALPGRNVSDLVQSVLVGAFAKIRRGGFSYRSDKELRSWLVRRLRWTYKRWKKRARTYDTILRGLMPRPAQRTPGSEVVAKERARLLAEARGKLDPADRQLIEWRDDERLTFKEIGRRRGYSTSYARRDWLAARRRLRLICRSLGGAPST